MPAPTVTRPPLDVAAEIERLTLSVLERLRSHPAPFAVAQEDLVDWLASAGAFNGVPELSLVDAATVLEVLGLDEDPELAEEFAGYSSDPWGDLRAAASRALQREALRRALERLRGERTQPAAVSLEAFATRVLAVARECPGAGPYSDREKVYICDVADRLGADPEALKARLETD